MNDEAEVFVERRGRAGVVTLNHPRAINALTHGMVRTVSAALDEWRDDPAIAGVVITGSGDRGLCAGGDVVSLHRAATTGEHDAAADFWRDEYRMNAAIARYPKPVVAIQDGLVLGGGIGISAHASHRVVTERSRLGFPEVTIGFVPDVGASWLLSRAPGASGIRLALTAESIGPADAIHVGFSDWFVPSDRIPRLLTALESEDPSTALAILAEDAGASALAAEANEIDEDFSHSDVSGILDALRVRGAHDVADTVGAKSPLALAVTRESLARARAYESLEEALLVEFRVSMHALAAGDFAEGVRAQLIEKDRRPRWNPASLDDIDEGRVAAFFDPPPGGDLEFESIPTSKETS